MNPLQKIIIGGAFAGTALLGGAAGAALIGTAGAQTPSTTSTAAAPTSGTGSSSDQAPAPAPDWSKGGHQANGKTESVLSGDDASKAIAAAEAAVPGATAQRAETDAEGATYEVHMTKDDGSVVTVKLDADFNVTDTIDGMG